MSRTWRLEVLRHRVVVSYEAEAEDITSDQIIVQDPGGACRYHKGSAHERGDYTRTYCARCGRSRSAPTASWRTHWRDITTRYSKAGAWTLTKSANTCPGDEVRTIDWNVTARAGRPFIKKFAEERELTLLLLVDVSASGHFGSGMQSKRDVAAELACVLALSATRNNDKVGLVLFTDQIELYIPPKKGRRHVLRVVREILFFRPMRRGTDIVQALEFSNRMSGRRSVVFLISDFQSAGIGTEARSPLRRAFSQAARRHDLVAVNIRDPREQSLPDVGVAVLQDAETGEVMEVDTASRRTRELFAGLAQKSRDTLLAHAERGGHRQPDAEHRPALSGFADQLLSPAGGASFVSASAPDIRDIRAPYLIPPDWRVPALVAAAAVVLLALLWWGWRALRARRPPLTLLQRTLQQLEATRALWRRVMRGLCRGGVGRGARLRGGAFQCPCHAAHHCGVPARLPESGGVGVAGPRACLGGIPEVLRSGQVRPLVI